MFVELPLILALVSQPVPAQAVSGSEAQRRFFAERLVRAGFPPIQPTGVALRRLQLSDPYGMLGVPGLEVRRDGEGTVHLVIQYPEWRSEPVAVDAAVWDAVSADEVFAPPPAPRLAPTGPPPPPPPVCHAWSAVIQDEAGRTAAWSACSPAIGAGQAMTLRMVTAAMATRPDCPSDAASSFFAFQRCFGLRPELDDATLEAAFSPLRRQWGQIAGAEALAAARRALQSQEMRRGDAAWTTARRAVDAVRATQTERRDLINGLARISHQAVSASQGDRYKISQSLEHWSDFTNGQDRNYVQLLEQLLAIED